MLNDKALFKGEIENFNRRYDVSFDLVQFESRALALEEENPKKNGRKPRLKFL